MILFAGHKGKDIQNGVVSNIQYNPVSFIEKLNSTFPTI
ncbi:Uncharacterised protein [Sphingobacterium spiritivorum]|uniref:Uncharacterized protein n=1 Tax=Sphingobacterium spiritivorum TaxID=258 RepID=A0A380BYG4_SPHSI|nr:Uncharacterised protein [Sphingobacterium spiritivorum]